jgi:membrane-bound lytic murein transglycosylase D
VVADDTMATVARTYHVTVSDLAEANEMEPTQSLSGTEALVVPVAPVATPSLHTLVYTTRRGDTLVSIADRFGVSLDQLRRWNKISSGIRVEPGRRLHVAEPASAQRASGRSRRGTATSAKRNATAAKRAETTSTHQAANPSSPATKAKSRRKLYAEKQK